MTAIDFHSAFAFPPRSIGQHVIVCNRMDHPRECGKRGVVVALNDSCCPYTVLLPDGTTLALNESEMATP